MQDQVEAKGEDEARQRDEMVLRSVLRSNSIECLTERLGLRHTCYPSTLEDSEFEYSLGLLHDEMLYQ